jgi:hypothetical protein
VLAPGLRLWLLAFAGFFLTIGAWSIAAPYDGSPDEMSHVQRAAAVFNGQIAPRPANAKDGTGAYLTVPGALDQSTCWAHHPTRSATCARQPDGDRTPVRVANAAGRYNPLYYALVGLPLHLWPDMTGVLLARLISGALCAALLAAAFVSAARRTRYRMMTGGLLLATTPMAMEMASAVNPNGIEIAAGCALFAAAIPLLAVDQRAPEAAEPRRAKAGTAEPWAAEPWTAEPWTAEPWTVGLLAISAMVLVTVRSIGPAWLAIAAVALLPGAALRAAPRRAALGRLWRGGRNAGACGGVIWPRPWRLRAHVRWAFAGMVVASAASVGWIVTMKATRLGALPGHPMLGHGQALLLEVEQWRNYVDELVGVFAQLDTTMWAPAYLVWETAAGGLLGLALLYGARADRWRLAVLTAGPVALTATLEVRNANRYGLVTQGRYLLPILGGALLLAAWTLESRGLPAEQRRRLTRLVVAVTAPIQLLALATTMVRYQSGIPALARPRELNPFAGSWHPVLGPVAPLAAAVVGIALVSWLTWQTAAVAPGSPARHSSRTRKSAGNLARPAAACAPSGV